MTLKLNDEANGNWWLEIGENDTQIGFWPQRIFSGGLNDLATYLDWGGEAYSPPNESGLPQMGSGFILSGSVYEDSFCEQITTINEAHDPVDAGDTEVIGNENVTLPYGVRDYPDTGGDLRHLVSFGGPGS
ncbi:hypothetical protein TorRG33x02_030160 [Trema orientale]|uniref:Neprosin PEP catalytic domain-containing protein n=1 Tax=Trema orientale TaxID=63057 RepID=A0A2P5FTY6_TREOI|nr:hypothetical protein TorRG33x02_030160 [Trema orientale]